MFPNNQSQIPETSTNDYLGSSQTVLERMGGYPKYWLEGVGDLSERSVRKRAIAEKIQAKHRRPNLSLVTLSS